MELVPTLLLDLFFAGLVIICFCLFPSTVANPLEEIANEQHRRFMMEYIREWPFLPQIAYMVGEIINAELDGAQQKGVVQVVDCSLIQVLFLVSTCSHDTFIPDISSTVCGVLLTFLI